MVPTTFEVQACHIINRRCRVAVVVVYRLGSEPVSSGFLDELAALMERVSVLSSIVYVVGDFNVRFDRTDDHHAAQVRSIFDGYGFCVSTSGPTHRLGGMLDIVAARTAASVSVIDAGISDHHLIR